MPEINQLELPFDDKPAAPETPWQLLGLFMLGETHLTHSQILEQKNAETDIYFNE